MGGGGVQRWLKMSRYLPEFGWQPIILTVQNGEYPALDQTLVDDVPENLKVYTTRTVEFYNLFKRFTGKKKEDGINTFILDDQKKSWSKRFSSWIRSNLFIPDGRVGWYFYAVKEAERIIEKEGVDLVFSS